MALELGLKGRTALITGGSKGIGRAIARGLAREGVNLVLLARGQELLDRTAEEIRKETGVKVEVSLWRWNVISCRTAGWMEHN